MTSQAQAGSPLPFVLGLVFMGFPLHLAKRASDERALHLEDVKIPMLFLQGTRDELADLELMKRLAERLGPRATLRIVQNADHSFAVPARDGRTRAQIMAELIQLLDEWLGALSERRPV